MDINKIEKLKVIKINKSNIIVENQRNQKGIIFIKELSKFFLDDLNSFFEVGDIVYGYLIKTEGFKRFYSLKRGHLTKRDKNVPEIGGGFLGILFLLDKLEQKEKKL